MSTVAVVNQHGERTGEIELNDAVFGAPVLEHLFYDVVRMQLAARRSAHPATRSRARVSGGGKKPYRQKGTGQARQGSSRAPHWRGGGVVFGPNGRKYTIALNKKVRRAALRSALSLRLSQQALVVVDDILLDAPKTRLFAAVAAKLDANKALFVTAEPSAQLSQSSRNIQGLKVLPAVGLNVYDILRHPRLVLTRPAVHQIEARLKG